jgi:hypothetical protein
MHKAAPTKATKSMRARVKSLNRYATAAIDAAATRPSAEECFRAALLPVIDDVGVLATTHEDSDLTFLYVSRTHPSWARVKAYIHGLPAVVGERVDFFCAIDDRFGKHGCLDADAPYVEAVRALVPRDERAAWTSLHAWPSDQPFFTNAEIIFMPSYS